MEKCQQRVERIFGEIESHQEEESDGDMTITIRECSLNYDTDKWELHESDWWQALKKREGIE